jgi:hypothetical protein
MTRFGTLAGRMLAEALVAGTVGLTYALAFVMPSNMGRIAVLMPVVMAQPEGRG